MRPLLAGVLAALFVAFTVEGAVRLSGRAGPFVTDPAFRWVEGASYWTYQANGRFEVYGPTWIETGDYGERIHARPGPEGRRRTVRSSDESGRPLVLVVGDSFTFGQAVASVDTWPAQLEQLLALDYPEVRVLNAGVQGHSLNMIISHAGDLVRQIQPDLVLIAFIADDLDPRRDQKHIDRFGYIARGKADPAPAIVPELVRALARRSHALLLAKQWWERSGVVTTFPDSGTPSFDPEAPATPRGWIVDLAELGAHLEDTPLVLLNLDLEETSASARMRRELEVWMPEAPLLYLPPYLETLPPSARRVPVDGHPSAAAHRVYAQAVLPVVREHLSGATVPVAAIAPEVLAPR